MGNSLMACFAQVTDKGLVFDANSGETEFLLRSTIFNIRE